MTSTERSAPLATLSEESALYAGSKRVVDLILGTVGLAVFLVLLPPIALLLRLDSPGRVFFIPERVGQGGRPIRVPKFRTMESGAEDREVELRELSAQLGVPFKTPADPRVTRFGRWLRRSSLDELPQVLSVLKGDMSIVGPRPIHAFELAHDPEAFQRRGLVKPGLTGYHQVFGRSNISFERRIELDLRYVAERSLWRDLLVIARTIPVVLSGRGAM